MHSDSMDNIGNLDRHTYTGLLYDTVILFADRYSFHYSKNWLLDKPKSESGSADLMEKALDCIVEDHNASSCISNPLLVPNQSGYNKNYWWIVLHTHYQGSQRFADRHWTDHTNGYNLPANSNRVSDRWVEGLGLCQAAE